MEIQDILAANVRRLRKAQGLGQEKFALQVGIDRTYVSAIERGRRNPTIAIVARFAEALEVAPHVLLTPPPDVPPAKKVG